MDSAKIEKCSAVVARIDPVISRLQAVLEEYGRCEEQRDILTLECENPGIEENGRVTCDSRHQASADQLKIVIHRLQALHTERQALEAELRDAVQGIRNDVAELVPGFEDCQTNTPDARCRAAMEALLSVMPAICKRD